MFKILDKEINVTSFSDGTSQVWQQETKLLDAIANNLEIRIKWNFEHEGECFQLMQLMDLLAEVIGSSMGYKEKYVLDIPFLPYGRQDKPITNHSTFALITFAGLLNYLDFSKVVTLDAHSNVLEKHFNGEFVNIFPRNAIQKAITLSGCDTICYPDSSAFIRYNNKIGHSDFITLDKVRDPKTGDITNIIIDEDLSSVNPKDKQVLMVDDICDGGGTFIFGNKVLQDKGVKSTDLFTTHGIYSKGLDPLRNGGINKIINYKGLV